MKIQLELEDFRFATTNWERGDIRWLLIKIGGKQFSVRREIEAGFDWGDEQQRNAQIDKYLIQEMQIMLAQILRNACAAIPEGTQILKEQETVNGN